MNRNQHRRDIEDNHLKIPRREISVSGKLTSSSFDLRQATSNRGRPIRRAGPPPEPLLLEC